MDTDLTEGKKQTDVTNEPQGELEAPPLQAALDLINEEGLPTDEEPLLVNELAALEEDSERPINEKGQHPQHSETPLTDEGQPDLPMYTCHKQVGALQITNMNPGANILMFAEHDPIRVDAGYFHKHSPRVNGYYVVYEDGYESFSPQEVFEAGYTLNE